MFNRNFTIIINWILDNLIPPIIRDNRLIMSIVMYPIYGKYTKKLFIFKERYPKLNEAEINKYYEEIKDAPINLHRKTDLNSKCIEFIVAQICNWGGYLKILDAAAGRGYLAEKLSYKYDVVAMDIVIPKRNNGIKWVKGDLRKLPFADKEFDVVICTHAIEHIREYGLVIDELKRVSSQYVIIVMPCQREYKYTVDLHVNFCPYLYRFQEFINEADAKYFKVGGDWICIINLSL